MMTPEIKKNLVRFVLAGTAALLIRKVESLVNDKVEDHFKSEEPSKD